MLHVDLRLTADGLDFLVDVHVHRFDAGWLAVADVSGDAELGWGTQPDAAIATAICAFGPRAKTQLVAAARKHFARQDVV